MSDDRAPSTLPNAKPSPSSWVEAARARTPAKILVGRVGSSYRTSTQLDLLDDHAAAVDAVHAGIQIRDDFGANFVTRWGLFAASTRARSKAEYLLRPDLGRRLDDASLAAIREHCPAGRDVQVAIGDGLSAAAVVAQVPGLLPLLERDSVALGLSFGRPFFIQNCRVGVLNDIGAALEPAVVILLIGERPGLATAESLSAYLAYRPRAGDTDAHRNLISNIHDRGTPVAEAAPRILRLASTMIRLGRGGVGVTEDSGLDALARPSGGV